MKRIISTLALLSALMVSCYYDSEESLYPDLGSCDTLNITYLGSIVPILNDNCLGCHAVNEANSKGGQVVLEGYSNVINNKDAILSSINHTSANPMPKDAAKLKDCLINQFEIWVSFGSPNN